MTIAQYLTAFIQRIMAQRGKKALGKAVSVSVMNQVISSGTNFALGIYLVRMLAPADFGLYGIGFAISLFYAGIGNALFLTQMVVHTPDKAPEDRLPYAGRMFVLLTGFCFCTIALLTVLLLLLGATPWEPVARHAGLAAAVIGASVAYLLKDFFVRHSYTARREPWALYVNATVAFTLAVLFLILRQTKTEIDSTTGLWIYAASNITGAVIGLMLARLPLHALKASALAVDAREAWRGGKWALNGTSISWLQSQAYMYITAILAGPVGVAHANAARLFITPAAVLMPALSQVVMPRFATQFSTHPEKIRPIWSLFTVGLIIAAIFYSAILLSTADIVTPLLLKEEYEHITPLIAAWCLLLIFQFSLGGTSIVLQIMKLFKTLTILNVKSACLAIAAVFVLTKMFGVQGAILGAAAGELALSVLMYQAVKQKFRNTVKSIK